VKGTKGERRQTGQIREQSVKELKGLQLERIKSGKRGLKYRKGGESVKEFKGKNVQQFQK
jgi:hypothetical protein